jgi:hypothetical protein
MNFLKINTLASGNKKILRFTSAPFTFYPGVLILRFTLAFHFILDSLAEFGYFYRLKNDYHNGPSLLCFYWQLRHDIRINKPLQVEPFKLEEVNP